MKKLFLTTFSFFTLFIAYSQLSLTRYVNPFIGTGGHGHTYPGASMPFGMVQLSPDTRLDGWDGCSGYHASDTVIYGFSHTHLSGTGCSDYGDILFMPAAREVNTLNYNYASSFDPATEQAQPGFYSVYLKDNKVQVDLTVTPRTGFHSYVFRSDGIQNIVIDLKHRDKVLECGLKVTGPDEVEGYRISQAWAQRQIVYFAAKFSKPFKSWSTESGDELLVNVAETSGDNIRAIFSFDPSTGDHILVKVGISGVSAEGARMNLENELPGWDFDKTRDDAREAWESELSRILVEGGTPDQQTTFYTALYHVMLNPNLYMDVDGSYRGRDLEVHKSDGFRNYTVFSLWDTYRAAHPLFALIDRRRTGDFINTFIHQYEEGGMLPVWELSGNETNCMIGYHAVPVIADAWIKGVRGFDEEKALEAMKHSAEQDQYGLKYYRSMGYIPADKEGESVSKTLEYAYDDWCIAQFAEGTGHPADYDTYIKRAQYYKNLYDPATGFMRAKQNGTWFSPFDPFEVNFNYTEANAWQYSLYVPQDIDGLMALTGGREKLAQRLDDLFAAKTETSGRDQADISGLIGQYAHGNEPSHHMAYLYDYVAQPWKTQNLVHRICREFYGNTRNGLIGNEDCGQMSAWYVFSAMGFYPVTPASDIYAIGTPLFPKATIRLESGRSFTVVANGISDSAYYIQSAALNGIPYDKSFIDYKDILSGGELVLRLGSTPNLKWGSSPSGYPASSIQPPEITPVPAVTTGSATFIDSTLVTLNCPDPKAVIRYTIDGTDPTSRSKPYSKPFLVKETRTLKAVAVKKGFPDSFMVTAVFKKIPKNRKITIANPYAPQYSAGGDLALIDFIRGGENFKTGAWQGYEGVDLDATIDLGSVEKISKVSAGFLQDQNSWIFYPAEIEVFVSADGQNFRSVAVSVPESPINDPEVRVLGYTAEFEPAGVRFVRLVARNVGTCPPWHVGAGGKAWLFADEIVVE
jgi:predicted alpha-1,2-mannosidase